MLNHLIDPPDPEPSVCEWCNKTFDSDNAEEYEGKIHCPECFEERTTIEPDMLEYYEYLDLQKKYNKMVYVTFTDHFGEKQTRIAPFKTIMWEISESWFDETKIESIREYL